MSKWINQTDIGNIYGITAVEVGRLLQKLDLKTFAEVKKDVLEKGIAKEVLTKKGIVTYLWNTKEVCKILDNHINKLSNSDRILIDIIKELFHFNENEKLTNMTIELLFDDLSDKDSKYLAKQIIDFHAEKPEAFFKVFAKNGKIKTDRQILDNISRLNNLLAFS